MRETETHIYFWNGIYSQWEPSEFRIDGAKYNCAEQYMMAEKARLFNDIEAYTDIMLTKSPSEQKAIGRRVKNFDPVKWNEVCRLVVYRANHAKFSQNPKLLEELIASHPKKIVEASPYDTIWGVGLHFTDDKILDEKNWKGQNLLGEAIMQVRSDLTQLYKTFIVGISK